MQKIIPHLWFDKEAKEATAFYTTLFNDSRIDSVKTIKDTPSGDCDMVSCTLAGLPFMAISAGPHFKFTPAISLIVGYDTHEKVDALWEKLSPGGKVLMPLGTYPFSERYGWVEDRFGLSWQIMHTKPEGVMRPQIVPVLLFVGEHYGQAEAAGAYYRSVFTESEPGILVHYGAGAEPNREGTVMYSDLKLANLWLAAMDGGGEHAFTFNEAFSFIVQCDTQEEIDYYWEKLSVVPEAEQCGWCKDQFGVSWQIVPSAMQQMMSEGTPAQAASVTQAFLKMKKFDIAALQAAYRGV